MCRTYGARVILYLFPALTRWANFCPRLRRLLDRASSEFSDDRSEKQNPRSLYVFGKAEHVSR